jgi:hypothetical protein
MAQRDPRPGIDEAVIENWQDLLAEYPSHDSSSVLLAMADQVSRRAEEDFRRGRVFRRDLEEYLAPASPEGANPVSQDQMIEEIKNLVQDLGPSQRRSPEAIRIQTQNYLDQLVRLGHIESYTGINVTDQNGDLVVESNIKPGFALQWISLELKLENNPGGVKEVATVRIELPENEFEDLILD